MKNTLRLLVASALCGVALAQSTAKDLVNTYGEQVDTQIERDKIQAAIGTLGPVRITDGNKTALSRWWRQRETKGLQISGTTDTSKFVEMDMGDSVTAPLGQGLSHRVGDGGHFDLPNALSDTRFSSNGTLALDQWTRTLSGTVHTLANTNVLTYTPNGQMTGIWLQYLAKSGNGSVKMSYQVNKAGSYIDSTKDWTIETISRYGWGYSGSPTIMCSDSTGIEVGMTATASGIPGATTVTAIAPDSTYTTTLTAGTSTTVVPVASVANLAIGMRVETSTATGAFITSINPGGLTVTLSGAFTIANGASISFRGKNITLSANLSSGVAGPIAFSRSDAGSSSGGIGTLNTNNSTTEKFCTAYIPLPNSTTGADYYNIKLTATGSVDICGIGTENGGLGFAAGAAGTQPGGVLWGKYGEGGKRVDIHFNTTPQDVFNRAMGWLNPEIISFKGLNDWNLASLTADMGGGVTRWDQYIGKMRTACPNALFVIFSTHVTQAFPLADSASYDYVLMDKWMRNWCAQSGFAVFIDARQNYANNNQIQGNPAGLSNDGLHQYGLGSDLRGNGEWYNVALAIDALMPVLQSTGPYSSRSRGNNSNRLLGGDFNRIALNPLDTAGLAATYSPLNIDIVPRSRAFLGFRPAEGLYNGGLAYGHENLTGIGMKPMGTSTDTSPGALELLSNGNVVVAFGNYHTSGQANRGAFFGGGNTVVADSMRNDGWRFLQPWYGYGNAEGLVIQSQTGNTAAAFAINSAGSVSAKGTRVWAWFPESGNVTGPKTIIAPGTVSSPQPTVALDGRVNFGAAATSLVVNNSLVTTSSIIQVTKATNDSTARLGAAVAGTGSFTIYMDVAPAAECAVNYHIAN